MCLECDYKSCKRWLHIRCGIDHFLIRHAYYMKEDPENSDNHAVFCGYHEGKAQTEIDNKGFRKVVKLDNFIAKPRIARELRDFIFNEDERMQTKR